MLLWVNLFYNCCMMSVYYVILLHFLFGTIRTMYSPYTRQLDEVAALGLLQYMSQDQLKPYMDSDAKVDEYIADNAQVRHFSTS